MARVSSRPSFTHVPSLLDGDTGENVSFHQFLLTASVSLGIGRSFDFLLSFGSFIRLLGDIIAIRAVRRLLSALGFGSRCGFLARGRSFLGFGFGSSRLGLVVGGGLGGFGFVGSGRLGLLRLGLWLFSGRLGFLGRGLFGGGCLFTVTAGDGLFFGSSFLLVVIGSRLYSAKTRRFVE